MTGQPLVRATKVETNSYFWLYSVSCSSGSVGDIEQEVTDECLGGGLHYKKEEGAFL